MRFTGITITVNYPDDEAEADIPSEGSLEDIIMALRKLAETEQDMTSFVLTAAKAKQQP